MKVKLTLLASVAALVLVSFFINRETNPRHEEPKEPPAGTRGNQARLKPGRVVAVETNKGEFKFVMYEDDAPITCKNFVDLVGRGFYKGLKFHRVEDWVVQGGDPKGDGTGGSGETIRLEVKPGLGFDLPFAVGMARGDDPNSASSQFFITKRPVAELNFQYAAFGQVFQGQEAVSKLRKGDVIQDVKLSPPSSADLGALDKLRKQAQQQQRAGGEDDHDHSGHEH